MLFSFNLVTECMLFTVTVWRMATGAKSWSQNVFSKKYAVQIVAIGNRQHTEIGLGQCDIRRSCSSSR